MTDDSGVLGKPFNFQVAAWRIRLAELKATANWKDVWKSGHDRSFMVAGVMKAELLADFATALDKAITKGTSLAEFGRDFDAAVEAHDWKGWTGSSTEKGRAWRKRVIYQTNLSVSYAAGRHAQLLAGKFKYWVYFHGNSRDPRPEHQAWNGLILPSDHLFWRTHYPPNGWGCSCYVIGARSLDHAVRLGGKPDLKLPDGWDATDAATGEPQGISKGWGYAPGATAARDIEVLRSKLEDLPEQISIAVLQQWVRSSLFSDWQANPVGNFPLVRILDDDAARLGSLQQIAVLSPDSLAKQLAHHPDLSRLDYALAQDVVSKAEIRVLEAANKMIFARVTEDGGHVLVVKAVVERGELFVVSFRRMSAKEAERDRDIRTILRRDLK